MSSEPHSTTRRVATALNLEDQDPPVPRISRIEERERLLAEALAHAEALEAQYRVLPAAESRHRFWKAPLALLIFVMAGFAAASPPVWIAGPPPMSIQEGDLERGLRAAVYLQALQVEVFRLRTGRLPDDLAALPVHVPRLRFVRSNTRVYQILARRPGGRILLYDSAHPAPAFAAVASAWAEQGAP